MFKKKCRSLDKNNSAEIFFSKPDKYRDIEKISGAHDHIITMGSCNSYTPASFGKNNLSIELTKFNRIIEFDKKNKLITVEAGINLSDLFNFTLRHALWIPQIPGYPSITIGGAIASNAHGKSCGHHGTIRNQIKKMKLFHKVNGWLNLSPEENKDIFDLTIGGFGLTGSIIEVQLELVSLNSNNFITKIQQTNSIIDTINKMSINNHKETYSYSWNRADGLNNFGKGFIFQNEIILNKNSTIHKNINSNKINIDADYFFNFWNKYTIKISQLIYFNYFKFYKSKQYIEDFQSVIFPFIGKEFYFKLFGKKGFIESQIIVPYDKKDLFVEEIEMLYKKYNPNITLFSLKKFKGENNYLRFEDNGICFTFDLIKNSNSLKFLDMLDKICEKYQFIPSIIKDSRLRVETIKKCYKNYDNFKNSIYEFDKKRTYRSTLSENLEI